MPTPLTDSQQHLNGTYSPQDRCIHHLFEKQVEYTPNAIALVFEDQQLTYHQLNQRANQLAHYLKKLGVGPEVLVGIHVERSLEMIIGVLGVLKAGGAYVPLDPNYPQERLLFMMEDAQIQVLLTQQALQEKFASLKIPFLVCLDTDWKSISQIDDSNPTIPVTLENLAYVIYTSGSTGKPKGVMVEHRGLPNLILTQNRYLGVKQENRILQFASLSFDVSVSEIFMALVSGSALYLGTRDDLFPGVPLLKFLRERAITIAAFPPSLLAFLPVEPLPSLHTLIVAGEACSAEVVAHWKPGRHFFNAYGPTETSVYATIFECFEDTLPPPIGRPLPNLQAYVLDSHLHQVPVGTPGELYLGGIGLARGYLNRPEITAERFIPNPFNLQTRIYRTGDLVRSQPDGNLEFLGRIDYQVKIRGFRIELGEIESVLKQDPTVRNAIVVAREDSPGDKRLVAYIVSNLTPERLPFQSVCLVEFANNLPIAVRTEDISCNGVCLVGIPHYYRPGQNLRLRLQLPETSQAPWLEGTIAWSQGGRAGVELFPSSSGQAFLCRTVEHLFKTLGFLKVVQRTAVTHLRRYLKEKLPDYMMPSSFVFLGALPLTPNGKIDRQALPAPDHVRPESPKEFEAPNTPTEEIITHLWTEVLHMEQVGIHDDFIELGGHSLLAAQVISRVRDIFQIELPMYSLFEWPTVAKLARQIEKLCQASSRSQNVALIKTEESSVPLSFSQQQLWLLSQVAPEIPIYNEPFTVYLGGPINVEALTFSFNEIVRRHEILRTFFTLIEGQPYQNVSPFVPFKISVMDLRKFPEKETKALQLATEEAKRPFDLSKYPLFRATLIQLDDKDYRLFLTFHHILIDGISIYYIFLSELETLYKRFSQKGNSALPPLPIQYKDFAVWQRQSLQEKVLEEQLAYWKQKLHGVSPLHLPTSRQRPAHSTFQGARQCLALSKELTDAIKSLSRREGMTLFVTLLAAFKTLLYRYTNQEDITIGTVTAGRNHFEIENIMGYFLNPLVLRTDASGNPTFRQFLKRVRETTIGAYSHQELPFEQLVNELKPTRSLGSNPLFQVAFVLETPLPKLELGWTLSQLDVHTHTTKFDLTMSLDERPEGVIGRIEYNTDLFEEDTITRMIGHFQTLLEGIVLKPNHRLSDLPLLTAQELLQLWEWSSTSIEVF